MGFYDCRCMITGVSLKASQTAAFIIQPHTNGYVPLTLAVFGTYDRLGSLDSITEDANTQRILDYFRARHADKTYVIDADYFRSGGYEPLSSMEALLWGFERNVHDGTVATLHEQPLALALIDGFVVEALSRPSVSDQIVNASVQEWFRDVPEAKEIYGADFAPLADLLRAWTAIEAFVAEHRIAWKPDVEPEQHGAEEMREFLEEARTTFQDTPVIQEALDAYEKEVQEFLDEE